MNSGGNIDEFVRLFSRWTNSIYSYIHVLAPVHADAEDIFQETSKTLWEKFGEFHADTDEGFRAWALRIAQIEVLRYRQRRGRREKLFGDQLQAALDETAAGAIESVDLRLELLNDCYRKLSEEDRRLIDARYQIAATVDAIAAESQRSVHAIYRSLRRIHQALFDCVQQARLSEEGPPSEKERRP